MVSQGTKRPCVGDAVDSPEMPASWIAQLREVFRSENKSIHDEVVNVKTDLATFKTETKAEISALTKRMIDLETSDKTTTAGSSASGVSSAGEWRPQYVDIKRGLRLL
eukprot:TRINITY_DN59657_c0_g1_i1.p2 TRINITY_DN59657_c0_g1~~TRINITY_DN59657_c0_g1_i1.p2  ORF type:complete len:108 (+),score=10.31 TRINITY_DN59657_c0_g1_i1:106-429(+)